MLSFQVTLVIVVYHGKRKRTKTRNSMSFQRTRVLVMLNSERNLIQELLHIILDNVYNPYIQKIFLKVKEIDISILDSKT